MLLKVTLKNPFQIQWFITFCKELFTQEGILQTEEEQKGIDEEFCEKEYTQSKYLRLAKLNLKGKNKGELVQLLQKYKKEIFEYPYDVVFPQSCYSQELNLNSSIRMSFYQDMVKVPDFLKEEKCIKMFDFSIFSVSNFISAIDECKLTAREVILKIKYPANSLPLETFLTTNYLMFRETKKFSLLFEKTVASGGSTRCL
ncbi:unnamed protein product [Moneuplotes crassus]|uniref:Uncharacterized protein n=1 Tax=Euplotes crassus TaxID=5936 RepID=A0AAD1UFK5_EUPCR|nr:unnamed protein product [Moneuplotes crassus]